MCYESVRFCLLSIILFDYFAKGQNLEELVNIYKHDGYGKTWMYFPDGDDIPRPISLDLNSVLMLRTDMAYTSDLEYRLYTRYNMNDYVLLDQSGLPLNETTIPIVEILSRAPIKLITHGWESSANKNSVINIKNAYLRTQDVNVIGVDWSSIAENILYPVVAYQTMMVGSQVAAFLNALSDRYSVSGDQVHLIGHSLGAHVMGNAGRGTKLNIDRITGLDPARPLFEFPSMPESVRLDASDAKFVDIIHTCGGIFGVESTIGHADFFPNSGVAPQPGCSNLQHIMEACSHSRAHFYFTESILYPTAFPAYQCRNWEDFLENKCSRHTFMGEAVTRNVTGNFYLETNQRIPYGRGINLSENQMREISMIVAS